MLTVNASDADLPAQTIDLLDQRRHRCGPCSRSTAPPATCPSSRRRTSKSPADFDGDNVYEVEVTADDNGGNTTPQLISVTVTPVNDNNPVFTSPTTANVAENTTAVMTVTATDADLPAQTVDLLDQRRGRCGPSSRSMGSGDLAFLAAPDYETPATSMATTSTRSKSRPTTTAATPRLS